MKNFNSRKEPTLNDLLFSLKTEAGTNAKTPTPRALREAEEKPVAEIPGLKVYPSGYAVYENGSGRSVFRAEDGLSFTFLFRKARPGENAPVPESCSIPRETLAELPWYIPLTLVGDYRVEYNKEAHRPDFSLDALDPGLADQYCARSGNAGGEDPESILIRRETRQEMLQALTGRQREVFSLYYLEGYNQYDIAGRLGLSRSAVTRLLDRAQERVRQAV